MALSETDARATMGVDVARAWRSRVTTRLAAATVSLATVIVVIGVAVAAFFNPLWIGIEQERASVPAITGYTPEQVGDATGSILSDVILGPPDFEVTVTGQPVLDAAERSHMVDVYNVTRAFVVVVGSAVLVLAVIVWANRRRDWVWRAISRGAVALAFAGVVIGVAVIFFFDVAFLLFHLVFFQQGDFSFDPRTERLAQLFPEQFWTETSIGIAALGLAVSVALSLVARRLAARRG
jgi:integral membrane protein (TIGR01906 family)